MDSNKIFNNFKTYLCEGCINEYGNQGPSSPECYLVKKDNTFKKISMDFVSKIPNLIYDMGGGETSYYDEYNVVVIDNFPIKDFADRINDNSHNIKKLYVMFNLEKYFSFPKANKIIIAQLVYYIKNIDNLAKTVNDSLKEDGSVLFFSDMMVKIDRDFLKILIEEYGFKLPQGINFNSLSKYKSTNIILQKNKSYIPPPEIYKFEIQNKITKEKGIITYEKVGRSWKETVDGSQSIKDDFYEKGKPIEWSIFSSTETDPKGIDFPEDWYDDDTIARKKYQTINKIQ